jgi:hypothetical protein
LNGVIAASLVERTTIERLQGVEDVIQRHKGPVSGSLRQFGRLSTAQASDAQEARSARLSLSVSPRSASTSWGP